MCGLSGIFDLCGERPIDIDRLRRMNQRLVHRGPDSGGIHRERGLGLGHRRLAIIDVAGGAQPAFNDSGSIAAVYNGEIYNHREIAAELKGRGHHFRTRSDTEVLIRAWEEWGVGCLDRFNGMFAFALWDRRERSLVIARDRLGEKPLYYSQSADGFLVFASELPSLVLGLPDVPDIDPQAVEEYFAYGFVPDPRTILQGVHKLPPGHLLRVSRGADLGVPQRYWDVAFSDGADSTGNPAELADRLREAVRLRLVSEVPIGAFLSGGVDSSSVVAMMAGLMDKPVKSCNIGFHDRRFDESSHAEVVARQYGTAHRCTTIDVDAASAADTLADIYGEPFADSSALPTYLVSGIARRRVTVSLSGDGGDEVFAGYRRHAFHRMEERVKAFLPERLRRPVFGTLAELYPKLDWAPRPLRAKATLEALADDAVGGYFRAVAVVPNSLRQGLYSADFKSLLGGYSAIEVMRGHAARVQTKDALSRALYLDLKIWLAGGMLVKVDRASMAHGLEVRAPFLDHTLVEWAATLPSSVKISGMEGKAVLKHAMEPYLPDDILYRPKQGFSLPLDAWLRGRLLQRVTDAIEGHRLQACGLFDRGALRTLLSEHVSGLTNHGRVLWAVLMFDAFLRHAAEARGAAALPMTAPASL